jgi:hypothetical protein
MIYFNLLKDILSYSSESTCLKIKEHYKKEITLEEYNYLESIKTNNNPIKATYFLHVLSLLLTKTGIDSNFLADLIKSENKDQMLNLYKAELESVFEKIVLPSKTETTKEISTKVETKIEDLDDLF